MSVSSSTNLFLKNLDSFVTESLMNHQTSKEAKRTMPVASRPNVRLEVHGAGVEGVVIVDANVK